MSLKEVIEVCKELGFAYNCDNNYCIYTQNYSKWLACYYLFCEQAIIFNSDEPSTSDKDKFKEGLQRKLKEIKEESIKDRIKSLEKDFV